MEDTIEDFSAETQDVVLSPDVVDERVSRLRQELLDALLLDGNYVKAAAESVVLGKNIVEWEREGKRYSLAKSFKGSRTREVRLFAADQDEPGFIKSVSLIEDLEEIQRVPPSPSIFEKVKGSAHIRTTLSREKFGLTDTPRAFNGARSLLAPLLTKKA